MIPSIMQIATLAIRMFAYQAAIDAGCATDLQCQRGAAAIMTGDCNEDDRSCILGETVTGDDSAPYCEVFVCKGAR